MPAHAENILAKFNTLRSRHMEWEERWQDISDFLIPRHGEFTGARRRGQNIQEQIFDKTGQRALQKAAAGLFSRASNPSTQWFFMGVDDPALIEDDPEAQEHLITIQRRMASVINKQLSNNLFQVYKVVLSLGTTALFIEEDSLKILKGVVFPLKDIFIAENHMGEVDTVYRRFEMTARQATQKWDIEKLSPDIRKAAVDTPEKVFSFIHVVMPRADAIKDKKGNLNMPFASIWMQLGNKTILEEGGYNEMPYMVPRIDLVDGETYGRGPGDEALEDIKTVNAMVALILDAANMSIRPPMDVPDNAYITPFRLTPAALNYNQEPGQKASPITTFTGDINITFNILEERRAAIRESFFNDQLTLLNQPNMTATEVLERVNQNMFLLGPWLTRLEKELFEPMIDRVFGIMQRKGMFPPVPESLSNQELRIIYDSPLARAQRNQDVAAIDDMTLYAANASQLNGGVLDNFDFDKMARRRSEIKGLPLDLLFSPDEVGETRELQAQAAADAAAAEQAQQLLAGAQAVSNLPGGEEIVSDTLNQITGGGTQEEPEELIEA